MLDDLFKLNPEELNVGFTKPSIRFGPVHAAIHAKSMPISTTAHAGHEFGTKPEILVSGLISGDRHDVGNFGHSVYSGAKIIEDQRREGGKARAA